MVKTDQRPAAEEFLFGVDGPINEARDLLIVAHLALVREIVHGDREDIAWDSVNAIGRIVGNALDVVQGVEERFKAAIAAVREERAERRAAA